MKKFLFALRSIGLTIVGLVIAILVTTGLHSFFGLFLDPLPMVDLQAADWSGRSEIMTRYMAANPFAVYSMLIAHGMGAALAVFFYTKTITLPSWTTQTRRKPFTGSIVLLALWLWGDVQNDLYDVPVCFGRPSTYWQQRHSPDWPLQLPEAYVNMKARKVLLPKMACTADNIGRP